MEHDRLFKELLTTFFLEFMELFFPESVPYLDPESIEFLDKEIFTDVTEGQRHEVDLLVRARYRGSASCFLIHVETQSQSQPEFAQRMFTYFARLHEKHRLQAPNKAAAETCLSKIAGPAHRLNKRRFCGILTWIVCRITIRGWHFRVRLEVVPHTILLD